MLTHAMSRNDAELIELTLAGHDEAFRELYDRYVRRVYNLAYRMVGRRGDPEELTQEIFYQVFRNLSNFQGKSQFYTWLYRVAANTCLQYLRKSGRDRQGASFDELVESAPGVLPVSSEPAPDEEATRRAMEGEIARAIDSLPENQRLAMILGPIQGKSYEEMAEILGVTVTVVKGRLHRARESMRALFRDRETAPAEEASRGAGRRPGHAVGVGV